MVDQNLLDRVRSQLIVELESAIVIYTKAGTQKWVNEATTRNLISALREKTPVSIVAPFWAEHLSDVLDQEGIKSGTEEYQDVWYQIEAGE